MPNNIRFDCMISFFFVHLFFFFFCRFFFFFSNKAYTCHHGLHEPLIYRLCKNCRTMDETLSKPSNLFQRKQPQIQREKCWVGHIFSYKTQLFPHNQQYWLCIFTSDKQEITDRTSKMVTPKV